MLEFRQHAEAVGQLCRSHLTAFTGELEQAVLVQAAPDPVREIDRLQVLEALDVFEHVARIRPTRRLAQPLEECLLAILLAFEQAAT